jgi:hypothetical protein
LREISLHILDIAENGISAGAKSIAISVVENTKLDLLKINLSDDGKGMDADTVKKVVDPFFTSRTTRKVGLGIPLLKEAAESCDGFLEIQSEVGKGTLLTVQFKRSHIDRMPMGDLGSTILHLIISNPQVHWLIDYRYDGETFRFDDLQMKKELADIPLTDPLVIAWLRETIEMGIRNCQPQSTTDNVTLSY